jgi:glyoxylase-like metal-dependent hydrolase (beta-lactamase superfamily II)
MPRIEVLLHGYSLRTDVGTPGFCSVVLVEGRKRTLVDVGHVGRRTFLQAALAGRGLTPADIDVTVMTHAHWDHNQNFDLFPNAPLLIHRWERKYARRPHRNDWATPQWTGAMIDFQPHVQEVEEGYEIEPGVWIMHTPGHSPGSMAVMVETESGLCAVTGDVLHYAGVALSRVNPLVFWSEKDARRSIDRILETAETVYPGHDRPFRLVKGKIEYLAPFHLTISGIDPKDPGLKFDPSPRVPWVMPGIEEQTVASLG